MSYDGDTNTVLKGVTHGAVDFLIKPVRLAELRNMWQHVVRKRKQQAADNVDAHAGDVGMKACSSHSHDSGEPPAGIGAGVQPHARRTWHDAGQAGPSRDGGSGEGRGSGDGRASGEGKKRPHPVAEEGERMQAPNGKRPRVHWSSEMHSQFVAAVNKLGIDKAVPKKILELMSVDGLTRENVASHLQKYRLYLKKASRMDGARPPAGMATGAQQHQPQQQQHQQQSAGQHGAQGAMDSQFPQYMGASVTLACCNQACKMNLRSGGTA